MPDAGGTAQVQYTDGTVEEMPVSRAIAITALEQLTGTPFRGPRMPQLRARLSEREMETPNPPRPQQTRPGGHPGLSHSEGKYMQQTVTILPIGGPMVGVEFLPWGEKPFITELTDKRKPIMTQDPKTMKTYFWSMTDECWVELRFYGPADEKREKQMESQIQHLKNEVAVLKTNLETAKAGVTHWKANHDNRVEAARVLIERPDMALERVDAYRKYLRALQVAQDVIEAGKNQPLPGLEVIKMISGDQAEKDAKFVRVTIPILQGLVQNGTISFENLRIVRSLLGEHAAS